MSFGSEQVFSNEDGFNIDTKNIPLVKMSQVQLPNYVISDVMSMSQYVQEAINNVDNEIEKRGLTLNEKVGLPFHNKLQYRDEW